MRACAECLPGEVLICMEHGTTLQPGAGPGAYVCVDCRADASLEADVRRRA
ncbi:MAG TPA: hypothetical protein VNZ52_16935 [Candidatus Thermoplasmatota archaeon]|nr:hypothetical protein [Candidatus Thermoplasmatota archaeon]